jgi:hypothetical protein
MTRLIRPWRPQGHFQRAAGEARVAAYEAKLGLGRANTDRDA